MGSESKIVSLGRTEDPKEALGWLAEKLERGDASSVFIAIDRNDGDKFSMKAFGGCTAGFICYVATIMQGSVVEQDRDSE